ncbi:hypothetical protein ABIA35_001343 [Catenulispora sp. MAP12-49]|uniref:hypothetical protein n=1 Tax=Catenulispora sp. MAP12-49 TaxID=3156302 RepID=UPI0035138B02
MPSLRSRAIATGASLPRLRAQRVGDIDPGEDIHRGAVVLMAMSAGLGLNVLLGQRPAADAFEAVCHHFRWLFH